MDFPETETRTLHGRGVDESARRRRPHLLAGAAIIGMLLALMGSLVLLSLWIFGPPPQVCRLPQLPVPETPGQLTWSPDSSRLLTAGDGGIYLLDLPGQDVRRVPLPSAAIELVWLDARRRPLALVSPKVKGAGVLPALVKSSTSAFRQNPGMNLLASHTLLRWEDGIARWRALPVSGNLVLPSADGRLVATLEAEFRAAASRSHVTITDLQTGKRVSRFTVPQIPGLLWLDTTTLCCLGDPMGQGNHIYRMGDPAPRLVSAGSLPQPSGTTAWVETQMRGAPEIISRLRFWQIPGLPNEDPADLSLAVGPEGRPAAQSFPLGRLKAVAPYGPIRPEAQVSPNGRYVAAVAGDGTLRLLDLKPNRPNE